MTDPVKHGPYDQNGKLWNGPLPVIEAVMGEDRHPAPADRFDERAAALPGETYTWGTLPLPEDDDSEVDAVRDGK